MNNVHYSNISNLQGKYVDRHKYVRFLLQHFYHKEAGNLHVFLHDGASAHTGRFVYLVLRCLGYISDYGEYGGWSGEGQICDRPKYHGHFKAISHRRLNAAQLKHWIDQKVSYYMRVHARVLKRFEPFHFHCRNEASCVRQRSGYR